MTIGLTWRRTARRIKRLKETVLAISPDYSDRPTPDLLPLSRNRRKVNNRSSISPESTFGPEDDKAKLFKQMLQTVERVVTFRNAVEHPGGHSGLPPALNLNRLMSSQMLPNF